MYGGMYMFPKYESFSDIFLQNECPLNVVKKWRKFYLKSLFFLWIYIFLFYFFIANSVL